MDYCCDIYVPTFNCPYFAILNCCICVLFWRLSIGGGSQNKDYIKNQYISRLNEEYIDTCSGHGGGGGHPIYLYNREIYNSIFISCT
jgi:hypothetical protein